MWRTSVSFIAVNSIENAEDILYPIELQENSLLK